MDKDQILKKYKALNIAEKLIVINVGIFMVFTILFSVFKSKVTANFFVLNSDFITTILNPWSILTYAFMHADFMHLFFNMLMLYYISKLFFSIFNVKLFLKVYLLGAIAGAIAFLLACNMFPVFFVNNNYLVGASAAITAILIFLCTSFPKQNVQVFTFQLKLWHIGATFVVLDVFRLFSDNSGGYIAHLGGALLGYLYAKQYLKGNDIGKGFEKIMKTITNWFVKKQQTKMKTVHKTRRNRNEAHQTVHQKNKAKQNKINVILDKISKSGYDSLTKEEKEFLFK